MLIGAREADDSVKHSQNLLVVVTQFHFIEIKPQ